MGTAAMCFSLTRVPRCGISQLVHFWSDKFYSSSRTCRYSSSSKLHSCSIKGLDGGKSRKWTRKPLTTNTEGIKKSAQHSHPSKIRQEILDVTASASTTSSLNKNDTSHYGKVQCCDIRQIIAENKDSANLVTVIVFDIETTGFHKVHDRIVEIAFKDLQGGENSTFQTLVNPERNIPLQATKIHRIKTHMVNKPGVPSMKELAPILLNYIRSRQKLGGYVLLVAHNGKNFDVPFLRSEFRRCGFEFPSNWLFADSLALARKAMKSTGSEATPKSLKLQDLREYFGIPLDGSAHRAMSDVVVTSKIFAVLTCRLKLTLSGLVAEHSFLPSDIDTPISKKKDIDTPKKKTSG